MVRFSRPYNLTLDHSALNEIDLWREDKFWFSGVFLSDHLVKALRAAKISTKPIFDVRIEGHCEI